MEDSSILDKVLSSKQISDIQNFNPSETVATLLKNVASKEEEIVRRRFGLGDQPKETLEEIGKRYAVTRERIRQIEDAAVKKIKAHKKFQEITHTTEELIRQILETHGGAMTEEHLFRELFREMEAGEADRRAVYFLLNELFTDKFDPVGKQQNLRLGWKLKLIPLSALEETIDHITTVIRQYGKAITVDVLMEKVNADPYFQQHTERRTEEVLLASMELSPAISKNPYQEYGLVEWGTIVPRRMNDKIYLVLKRHGKPLHFTEITKLINETGFDKRKAYPPTVHNELILNKQYVLVGRGIYALREWGYRPGVVADVLIDILRAAKEPLSREELVKRVLEQRMVKKNTIHLALADRTRFVKLPDARYQLAQPAV